MTASRRQPARALLLDASTVAPELVAFIREVGAHGIPVRMAVDSTVVDELGPLSLGNALKETRKLSREYFAAACGALATAPSMVLYVTADDRGVSAARVAGLAAYRWNGPADLPYVRAALGLITG